MAWWSCFITDLRSNHIIQNYQYILLIFGILLFNTVFPNPKPPSISILDGWSGKCGQFVLCFRVFFLITSSKLIIMFFFYFCTFQKCCVAPITIGIQCYSMECFYSLIMIFTQCIHWGLTAQHLSFSRHILTSSDLSFRFIIHILAAFLILSTWPLSAR